MADQNFVSTVVEVSDLCCCIAYDINCHINAAYPDFISFGQLE